MINHFGSLGDWTRMKLSKAQRYERLTRRAGIGASVSFIIWVTVLFCCIVLVPSAYQQSSVYSHCVGVSLGVSIVATLICSVICLVAAIMSCLKSREPEASNESLNIRIG